MIKKSKQWSVDLWTGIRKLNTSIFQRQWCHAADVPSLWSWAHQTSPGSPHASRPACCGRTPGAWWPSLPPRWLTAAPGCRQMRVEREGPGPNTLDKRKVTTVWIHCISACVCFCVETWRKIFFLNIFRFLFILDLISFSSSPSSHVCYILKQCIFRKQNFSLNFKPKHLFRLMVTLRNVWKKSR